MATSADPREIKQVIKGKYASQPDNLDEIDLPTTPHPRKMHNLPELTPEETDLKALMSSKYV